MVRVVVRSDGERRVVLLRRKDGRFTFVEQAGYEVDMAGTEPMEHRSWASLPSGSGIYETAAEAEQEANASIGWLRIMNAAATVLLIALLTASVGCSDACVNTVVSRVTSSDGRHDAVLFGRECGATTGLSTQVSVIGPGEQPVDAGNTFRADDNQGAAQTGSWGGPWAELRWLASDRLLVRHAARARLFEQRQTLSGVQISYEAISDR